MRFPILVMLEPYVFRRDDEDSFPDETKAPIRASATTSWGAHFSIAFDITHPPSISRLYAQLPVPGFRPPHESTPLAILGTHRHLALFRVGTVTPEQRSVQNLFIYRADKNPASSSLRALPLCTEPYFDYYRRDGRQPRRARSAPTSPRILPDYSVGLWCGGEDEFVVAELTLFRFTSRHTFESEVFADICFLRSSSSCTTADDQLGGTWHSKRVQIPCRDNPNPLDDTDDDAWQLSGWQTHTIIPCDRWLCWVDFYRGILFCDLSSKDKDPTPTVSFIRFPLHEFPDTTITNAVHPYRGVSVVDDGRALKFIDVDRDDGIQYGALEPGAGFTITCHTMKLSGHNMAWNPEADCKVTSGELWNDKYPGCLPRAILMFPQVDIDRPSVVHFLLSESIGHFNKKMWVVSLDMSKKVVDIYSSFINGDEGLEGDDAEWIKEKFRDPKRFLPCEFPKFLNFSSKRKRMG